MIYQSPLVTGLGGGEVGMDLPSARLAELSAIRLIRAWLMEVTMIRSFTLKTDRVEVVKAFA